MKNIKALAKFGYTVVTPIGEVWSANVFDTKRAAFEHIEQHVGIPEDVSKYAVVRARMEIRAIKDIHSECSYELFKPGLAQ